MKKQFLNYKCSKILKGLGFNKPCIAFYHEDNQDLFNLTNVFSNEFSTITNTHGIITSPIKQEAIDFLRENHNMIPVSQICSGGLYICRVIENNLQENDYPINNTYHKEYHEALDSAINQALDLVCNKNE